MKHCPLLHLMICAPSSSFCLRVVPYLLLLQSSKLKSLDFPSELLSKKVELREDRHVGLQGSDLILSYLSAITSSIDAESRISEWRKH